MYNRTRAVKVSTAKSPPRPNFASQRPPRRLFSQSAPRFRYRPYTSADSSTTSVSISVHDKLGVLPEIMQQIKKQELNMSNIQSRPSRTSDYDYEFYMDFTNASEDRLQALKQSLATSGWDMHTLVSTKIPWFPRKLSDLDKCSEKVLSYGSDLDADHPGFKDQVYRERRKMIASIAQTYKVGDKIPFVEYTPAEKETWRTVYNRLKALFPDHACKQHQFVFPLLEQNCGYSENNIPQLQDIADFLQDCTGFRLRPVTGLLSSREFLNGLAFRVFYSTQYIRHGSQPFYTPEPDVCHELLGHVPLFADADFAAFSQEIGLASLGASDADIQRLATCYWFTVEFGLCKEGANTRAYGAGLLSSFGELQHCLSDKPQKVPFDAFIASETKYPITQYQPLYYVTESFEDAKVKLRAFADTLDKPFKFRYDPYTSNIVVIDSKKKVVQLAKEITSEMNLLLEAIKDVD